MDVWVINGVHQVDFIYHQGLFSSAIVQVVAYQCLDSLAVNDLPIDLASLHINERCSYDDGFQIDLSEFLKPGFNSVHLGLEARKRYLKLQFINKASRPLIFALVFSVALSFGLTLYLFRNSLKIPKTYVLILTGAFALRLIYLHENAPLNNSHDVQGHLSYIEHLETTHSIPNTIDCWSCYHPPIYYLTAALWRQSVGQWSGLTPNRSLQLLSLLFDLGFLYAASRIFSILLPPTRCQSSALALLAFWPGAVIWSIRIGNENLLFPLLTFAFWRLLVWLDTDKKSDLILSSLLIAVALNVKSNALIALPVFGSLYLQKRASLFPSHFKSILRELSPIAIILIFAFAFAAFRPAHAHLSGKQESLLVGNSAGLNPKMAAPVDLEHLLGFDLPVWLEQPFINPWFEKERFYFSNYYLKTALFGEHQWDNLKIRILSGHLLSILLLIWILSALSGLFSLRNFKSTHASYLIFGCFWLLLAACLYRIYLPFTPCADIRFTAPFIIFWIPLISLGLRPIPSAKYSRFRNALGLLALFLWIASSTLFFTSAHFPHPQHTHLASLRSIP